MELVKSEQDPIVNVGIKQSQKDKIMDLIAKTGKYKSINEVTQIAVGELISSEDKKLNFPKGQTAESILKLFNTFNINLLKEDLIGLYKLNGSILTYIKKVKEVIDAYKSYHDELAKLFEFRDIKNILTSYITYLEEVNKQDRLGIPEYRILELKDIWNKFIDYIKAQEVKG